MNRGKRFVQFLRVAAAFLLLVTGCTNGKMPIHSKFDQSTQPYETSASVSENVNESQFAITEDAEGMTLMTGELSEGVHVRARVYCIRDIGEPGTASIDMAIQQMLDPSCVDTMIDPTWTVISDEKKVNPDGVEFVSRHGTFSDPDGIQYQIGVTTTGLYFWMSDAITKQVIPNRVPWYTESYVWDIHDYSYMSAKDAATDIILRIENIGLDVNEIYQVDRIPKSTLQQYGKYCIALGDQISRDQIDALSDVYYFQMRQNWNNLPITDQVAGAVFDGEHLDNDAYKRMYSTGLQAAYTHVGLEYLYWFNPLSCTTRGEEQPLCPIWEALQTLNTEIVNQKARCAELQAMIDSGSSQEIMDELQYQTLYEFINTDSSDMTIDQMELCYVPIHQNDNVYEMLPCWSFRICTDTYGTIISRNFFVSAITNEFICTTTYSSDSN